VKLTTIFISIAAPCTTKTFQKADGSYYCGFVIKDTLTWYQAEDACNARGGRLPEISSYDENLDILKLKVISNMISNIYGL
jgi:hypothetical protein